MMKTIEANGELKGYTGRILRIDLTDSTTSIVPTSDYAPRYVGGRAICDRIFWDEVVSGTAAFDPENKVIMMTGPGCATGLPVSGRLSLTGISPNSIPEMYTHSNMGGFFGGMLKWAGYDGVIIEGKAPRPTYVHIVDDKVEFLDAAPIWGKLVHETEEWIYDTYDRETHSIVIGPAGENLCRNASLTTSNDSVSAKSGFGAVFGSKNLKAIAVKGTGDVVAGDPRKVLELRMSAGNPKMIPNPVAPDRSYGTFAKDWFEDPDVLLGKAFTTCCQGCNNATCNATYFGAPNILDEGHPVTLVGKCMDMFAANYTYDCGYWDFMFVYSQRQVRPNTYQWVTPYPVVDKDDPDLPMVSGGYDGDRFDLWGPSITVGAALSYLCNQYGIDKWDTVIWEMTWLSMCKKEGLLDGIDFGMEVDVDNPGFIRHFLHMLCYREGPDVTLADGSKRPIGDLFAEGMGRAIRALGKEKYGDSIYHGRYNLDGENLEIPVSWESGWGHSAHWQGRGYQGCPKLWWVLYNLCQMMDSRDAQNAAHFHVSTDELKQYQEDPCHSEVLARCAARNWVQGDLKDSVITCDWKTPDASNPTMEAELFKAATGIDDVTEDDLYDAAEADKLLYRSILIRDFGRTRDLEVENIYPFITYPDPKGEVVNWDEWNDAVDLFYKVQGWDIATGWPTRETYERYGMKDVADQMELAGKLPTAERTASYTRKGNPFKR